MWLSQIFLDIIDWWIIHISDVYQKFLRPRWSVIALLPTQCYQSSVGFFEMIPFAPFNYFILSFFTASKESMFMFFISIILECLITLCFLYRCRRKKKTRRRRGKREREWCMLQKQYGLSSCLHHHVYRSGSGAARLLAGCCWFNVP
jgi:hypothetical protein